MSQYQKSCNYCNKEIKMSNDTGKWLPMNMDGSFHSCKNQEQTSTSTSTGTKKVETTNNKPLTLEELDARVKRLESFMIGAQK